MTKLEMVKKLAKAAAKQKGLEFVSLKSSDRAGKKYAVTFNKAGTSHTVHFGHPDYKDYLDTGDDDKRRNYLARATKIRDREGKLTSNNTLHANFWAVRVLWPKDLKLTKK
jgi:hypothetical protein